MMRRLGALLVVFLCCVGPALAGATNPWNGLWSLVQETETGSVVLHLSVKDAETTPVLYGSGWKPQTLVSWEFEETKMTLNWLLKGFNTLFEGELSGDAVRGTWSARHPMYSLDGRFHGMRVFSHPDWMPLKAMDQLESGSGLLDLGEYIRNNSGESEEEFLRFWRGLFVPQFYVFLGASPSPEEVFGIVQGGEYLKARDRLVAAFQDVGSRAVSHLTELSFNLQPVLVPYGKDEPVRQAVNGRMYVLVNPVGISSESEDLRYQIEVAQKFLTTFMAASHAPRSSGAMRVYTEGLPYYLTAQLGYSEDPSDFLLLPEAEVRQFELDRPEFIRQLKEGSISENGRIYFSYEFVRQLAERFSLNGALRMMNPQIIAEYSRWLQKGLDG